MTEERARRRDILRWGGLATGSALAGCSATQDGGDDGDGSTTTATPKPAASGEEPPGADVLGSEGSLESSATVRATVLDSDRGAGRFVFSPAVVFVERGATVTWEIEGAAHSATAYAEGNDRPQRVPDAAPAWDSGRKEADTRWDRTFETRGVHNYFCEPHEGLGMVGIVVVGEVGTGPGTTQPSALSGTAATHLSMQLDNAGISSGVGGGQEYGWEAATNDSYWYSLYNMSTNIAMSGNGVRFPHNETQREALKQRLPAILEAAGAEKPPVNKPWLNMAPFTEGSPKFTRKPVLSGDDGRPDASTLRWDKAESSKIVSPAAVAWTHLKGVTWAKNFQEHREILPGSMKPLVRAQVLTTLAQIGIKATLVAGGPEGNGALTKGDSLRLVSGFRPPGVGGPDVVDDSTRIEHQTAMLWFLGDLHSLAANGWFGYVNPEPLIPVEKLRTLMGGMFKATSGTFDPTTAAEAGSPRDLGLLLGGVGWVGSQADGELASNAATYANDLAAQLEATVDANGRVAAEIDNQAAAQGAVGQGLAWASQLDGVDHLGTAKDTLGYMRDSLFDADLGIYRADTGDVHRFTARDVGDITGGVNAANAVLGLSGVKDQYAQFFNQCVNRGRLQRAERPPSRTQAAEYTLPLPPKAGSEFGQAAVYNGAVAYDADGDEWTVTDERFYTAEALYLANQEIWLSNWGGDYYDGNGIPGQTDEPPN